MYLFFILPSYCKHLRKATVLKFRELDFLLDAWDIDGILRDQWKDHVAHTDLSTISYEPAMEAYKWMYEAGTLKGVVGQDEQGEICAFFYGQMMSHPYSRRKMYLHEIAWWIHPDYRKQKEVFKGLLDSIYELCDKLKIDILSMQVNAVEHYSSTANALKTHYGFKETSLCLTKVFDRSKD